MVGKDLIMATLFGSGGGSSGSGGGGEENFEIATGEYIPSEDILTNFSNDETEAKIDTGLGYLPGVFVMMDLVSTADPYYYVLGNCYHYQRISPTQIQIKGASWGRSGAGNSGSKVLLTDTYTTDALRIEEMEAGIIPIKACQTSGSYYLRAGVTYTWYAIGRASE